MVTAVYAMKPPHEKKKTIHKSPCWSEEQEKPADLFITRTGWCGLHRAKHIRAQMGHWGKLAFLRKCTSGVYLHHQSAECYLSIGKIRISQNAHADLTYCSMLTVPGCALDACIMVQQGPNSVFKAGLFMQINRKWVTGSWVDVRRDRKARMG